MEIILSKNCQSFTGSVSRKHGYSVRRTGNRFFGIRSSRGTVPPDGHYYFIYSIAVLTRSKLVVDDIRLPGEEYAEALSELGWPPSAVSLLVDPQHTYNARDFFLVDSIMDRFNPDMYHEN